MLPSTNATCQDCGALLIEQDCAAGWICFASSVGASCDAGVGVAAGYWPARNASNLKVVDALRDET